MPLLVWARFVRFTSLDWVLGTGSHIRFNWESVELSPSCNVIKKAMAEREGFFFRHFQQVVVIPTHSDNTLCLLWFQAHSQFRVGYLRRPLTTSIAHQNDITSITRKRCRPNGR